MNTPIDKAAYGSAFGRARARGSCLAALCLAAACASPAPPSPPASSQPAGAPPNTASRAENNDENDVEKFRSDVAFVSKARPPGSEHWRAVQERCAQVFEQAGLTVRTQSYGTGVNVIGELEGTTKAEELVMLSAHYDSVPNCSGADDNATGVAGIWRAARSISGERPERTLAFACWDEEERGLVGSSAFVSAFSGRRIVAHLVFEMIGYVRNTSQAQQLPPGFDQLFPDAVRAIKSRGSRGDFIAMVLDKASAPIADIYQEHAAGFELPTIRLDVPEPLKNADALHDLRRSDHATFWKKDWPSMMLTDTANFRNPNYHCSGGADEPPTLDYGFALKVVDTSIAALREVATTRVVPATL